MLKKTYSFKIIYFNYDNKKQNIFKIYNQYIIIVFFEHFLRIIAKNYYLYLSKEIAFPSR